MVKEADAESRRVQMLRCAAEIICERGFDNTRIADVAERAGTSAALVVYYFKTRDRLLIDALRYSETNFYDGVELMLSEVPDIRERLKVLIRWTCVPDGAGTLTGSWGLWFDLWAQAFRNEEVGRARLDQDRRWRQMIADVVRAGGRSGAVGEINADEFSIAFAALLDGLAIQVALEDPDVGADLACSIAMAYADQHLQLSTQRKS